LQSLGFEIVLEHEHIAMVRRNDDGTSTPLTMPNHPRINPNSSEHMNRLDHQPCRTAPRFASATFRAVRVRTTRAQSGDYASCTRAGGTHSPFFAWGRIKVKHFEKNLAGNRGVSSPGAHAFRSQR